MRNFQKTITKAAFVLLLQAPAPLLAQQASDDGVEEWRAIDAEFRQAIIDEVAARRGLAGNIDDPDELIRSADDIREVLRVSCELAGTCDDESFRATPGAQLTAVPDTDE